MRKLLILVCLAGFCFGQTAADFDIAKKADEAYEKGDYQKASNYYQKGCDGGQAAGCFNLGLSYAKGKGVKQNYQTAKQYYGKACDLGDQAGCDNYKFLNIQGY